MRCLLFYIFVFNISTCLGYHTYSVVGARERNNICAVSSFKINCKINNSHMRLQVQYYGIDVFETNISSKTKAQLNVGLHFHNFDNDLDIFYTSGNAKGSITTHKQWTNGNKKKIIDDYIKLTEGPSNIKCDGKAFLLKDFEKPKVLKIENGTILENITLDHNGAKIRCFSSKTTHTSWWSKNFEMKCDTQMIIVGKLNRNNTICPELKENLPSENTDKMKNQNEKNDKSINQFKLWNKFYKIIHNYFRFQNGESKGHNESSYVFENKTSILTESTDKQTNLFDNKETARNETSNNDVNSKIALALYMSMGFNLCLVVAVIIIGCARCRKIDMSNTDSVSVETAATDCVYEVIGRTDEDEVSKRIVLTAEPIPSVDLEETKPYIHYDTPYDHIFDRLVTRLFAPKIRRLKESQQYWYQNLHSMIKSKTRGQFTQARINRTACNSNMKSREVDYHLSQREVKIQNNKTANTNQVFQPRPRPKRAVSLTHLHEVNSHHSEREFIKQTNRFVNTNQVSQPRTCMKRAFSIAHSREVDSHHSKNEFIKQDNRIVNEREYKIQNDKTVIINQVSQPRSCLKRAVSNSHSCEVDSHHSEREFIKQENRIVSEREYKIQNDNIKNINQVSQPKSVSKRAVSIVQSREVDSPHSEREFKIQNDKIVNTNVSQPRTCLKRPHIITHSCEVDSHHTDDLKTEHTVSKRCVRFKSVYI